MTMLHTLSAQRLKPRGLRSQGSSPTMGAHQPKALSLTNVSVRLHKYGQVSSSSKAECPASTSCSPLESVTMRRAFSCRCHLSWFSTKLIISCSGFSLSVPCPSSLSFLFQLFRPFPWVFGDARVEDDLLFRRCNNFQASL